MYTKSRESNNHVGKSNSLSSLNSPIRLQSSLPKSNILHTLFCLYSQDSDTFFLHLQSINLVGKHLEKGVSAKQLLHRRARISLSSEKIIQHSYATKVTWLLQVIKVPWNPQEGIKKSSKHLFQKLLNKSNIGKQRSTKQFPGCKSANILF